MLAMQISSANPYTHIHKLQNEVWSQTGEDSCNTLPDDCQCSAKRNRYGSKVICPLDLLKYCDHTESKNSSARSF